MPLRMIGLDAGARAKAITGSRNSDLDGYGNPISSYYLWSIYWYATPDGPLAVAFEHDADDIVAINMATDHRVTLFTAVSSASE
jgi:hypothetical protein